MKRFTYLIQVFALMLFSAFSASMAVSTPMSISKITYFQSEIAHFAQANDVGFAARETDASTTSLSMSQGSFAAADDLGTRYLLGEPWDKGLTTSVFGNNLTVANLMERAFDATLSAGIQSAVTGADFGQSFKGSFVNSVVALGLADTQTGIGGIFEDDDNGGEGSIGHVLLHGMAGCVAAEAQGADCAAGAAGGISGSLVSGYFGRNPVALHGSMTAAEATAYKRVTEQQYAELISTVVGWAFSGGVAENVSVAAAVGRSAIEHNRQLHYADLEDLLNALGIDDPELESRLRQLGIDALDYELFAPYFYNQLTDEKKRVMATACALVRCDLHLEIHDNYLFRQELAEIGGSSAYQADRVALLAARQNDAAYSYSVADIYADIEASTGRDVSSDAKMIAVLDVFIGLADSAASAVDFVTLLYKADGGDVAAKAELDALTLELNATLSDGDWISEGFENAEQAIDVAFEEYAAAQEILDAQAEGIYVDDEKLRESAYYVSEFNAKSGMMALGIAFPSLIVGRGKFSAFVPDNANSTAPDNSTVVDFVNARTGHLGTNIDAEAGNPVDPQGRLFDALELESYAPTIERRTPLSLSDGSIIDNHGYVYTRNPNGSVTSRVANSDQLTQSGIQLDYENISTARAGQSRIARNQNEQIAIDQVRANPLNGVSITNQNDARFAPNGFQKRRQEILGPNGRDIGVHYQYNPTTGQIVDLKITSPIRNAQ